MRARKNTQKKRDMAKKRIIWYVRARKHTKKGKYISRKCILESTLKKKNIFLESALSSMLEHSDSTLTYYLVCES